MTTEELINELSVERPVLNVHQRFSMACQAIDSQPWVLDMENRQYKSIPIDKMRGGVRKACIKAGLVHVGPYDIEYEHTISQDGRTHRYLGTCKFAYINVDNPEEMIVFETMGEAMDNGDKGVGKFVTNLIKNHYKSSFDIGEQNEDDLDSYSNEEYEAKVQKQIEAEKVQACKDAIDDWFNEDPLENASNQVIAEYAKKYGKMETWKGEVWMACYKSLKASGVPVKAVSL